MAQPPEEVNIDLDHIHDTLCKATSNLALNEHEAEVQSLLEYSRIAKEDRKSDQHLELRVLGDILDILLRSERTDALVEINLLKCCGNLLADDDSARQVLLDTHGALQFLKDGIVFETIGDQDKQYERAALALKVAFNLCNDYEPAQKAAIAAGFDRAVLKHVHTCLFISKDDTTDLGIELMTEIARHLKDLPLVQSFDKDFVHQVLKLPCVEDVDQDTFTDMVTAISPYLAHRQFQEAILALGMIDLAFELLEKTVFMLSDSPRADEGQTLEALLLRTLADISVLPEFPASFTATSDFIRKVADRCVLTENDSDSANLAVCSCIILGNYASNASAAAAIITQIKMDGLHDFITLKAYRRSRASTSAGVRDHADYLHAAAGMLRHLAMSPEVREKYFRDQSSKQTAMALAQYPHTEVQVSGLRLLRQLIVDDFSGLDHIIHSSYHVSLLRLFMDPTTEDRIKLEISRTITALLREASKPSWPPSHATSATPTSAVPTSPVADATIPSLLSAQHLLEPVAYAITDSKLPFAQAEGFFGLCLVLRCSPRTGAQMVSSLLASHPTLLATMRSQLVSPSAEIAQAPVRSSGLVTEDTGDLPLQGPKTDPVSTSIGGRAKENAVILLSELLKSEGIGDAVRDSLDSIANEAGIALRL